VDLEGVDEFAAIRFLTKDKAHVSLSTRKQLAVRIRRFAKYLESNGHVRAAGMVSLPLNAPAWAHAGIPKTLSDEQVAAIKSAASRQPDEPLRDAAIAVCMANLGLRTCEVARLRVEDVDFARGVVTISLSKSKTSRILPLDRETGGALADYVTMGRPRIRGALFVRRTGEPMGAPGVRRAMRRVATHAGVHPFGCHMLRHTAACKMVNAGTPLKVIADVLGHESVETTTAYAKVDLTRMALVSADWPGDAHE
jgi:site-specific recombinase XerD